MLRLRHWVGALCVFYLAFSAPDAVRAQYAITDLGIIGSGPFSQAWGVNASGQVTGWSGPTATLSLGAHAFLCDRRPTHDRPQSVPPRRRGE